jgi:hypothetical protein
VHGNKRLWQPLLFTAAQNKVVTALQLRRRRDRSR